MVKALLSSKPRVGLAAALCSLLAFVLFFCTFYLTQLHRLLPKDGVPGRW